MLGLFITSPWPAFYKKGMKTWEIRSYPTNYRGDIILIDSNTNRIVCKMLVTDCIPLNKERWEMNYEKHRTLCSYEKLPYRKNNGSSYAWVLANPMVFDKDIIISRPSSKPYFYINDSIISEYKSHSISFKAERIACKFLEDTMLLYWIKKNYFALIATVDLVTGNIHFITIEISVYEIDYILNQLQVSC